MPFRKPLTRAFTLIELIVVVILIGIVAAVGIPNYEKTMERAQEKDAVSNLDIILEAAKLHMSHNDDAFPADLADIVAINSALTLNIIEQQGNTYSCNSPDANSYECDASNSRGSWTVTIEFDKVTGESLSCTAGTCPTIP